MGELLIKMEGQLRFLEKKCHNYWLTTLICMNESTCKQNGKKIIIFTHQMEVHFELVPNNILS
jgi:hypothetical protein